MDKKLKWYTVVEYVKKEDGIYITKSEYERGNYIITEQLKKYEQSNETYGIIKRTNICERNRQQKIEF